MTELTIKFIACYQLTKNSTTEQHKRIFSLPRSHPGWAKGVQRSLSDTGNAHLNKFLKIRGFTKEDRRKLFGQGVVRFWLEVDGKRTMLHPEAASRSLEDFLEYFEMIRPSGDKSVILNAALEGGVWEE